MSSAFALSATREINKHRAEILKDADALRSPVNYILESEGKRLRPLLLLCFANIGEQELKPNINEYRAAAAVELLHEASLIHDDILDNSTIRRDRKAVCEQFNVRSATHAGGYITSLCLATLAECDPDIGKTLSNTLKTLVYAQLMEELPTPKSVEIHQQRSIDIMQGKTGSLFKMAIEIGLHLNNIHRHRDFNTELASKFSSHFSLAFQMRDDLADLENDESIRKPGGNDLIQGNPTWPFLLWAQNKVNYEYAWNRLSECKADEEKSYLLQQEIIRSNITQDVRNEVDKTLDQAQNILSELPDSPARTFIHSIIGKLRPCS